MFLERGNVALSKSNQEHVSMIIYRGTGAQLISSATAHEIARRVLEDKFPEDASDQMPLSVSMNDGIWVVAGSKPEKHFGTNSFPDASVSGKFIMHISPLNGQILRLTF
jgi:hypothetical protein